MRGSQGVATASVYDNKLNCMDVEALVLEARMKYDNEGKEKVGCTAFYDIG